MDARCKATTKAGRPCNADHFRDGYCRWHHPDLEAQRQADRRSGGRAKSNASRARKRLLTAGLEFSDLDAKLCQALTDVLAGDLEPNVATAAATIARTVASIRTATDLETRIRALETRTGTRDGRGA